MTLQELHYTSAKSGPGGSSGFQFVKLADGVDPALCRQVEPLLAYEPPRSSPARPTQEEIAAFPVALSYTLLPQGGAILCNTTYTGTDYSGRYGNFYAHALHLPAGDADLGAILPIETWRSGSWCTGPDSPAANVAAGEIERGTIQNEALCHLAQQHHGRVEAFLTDVLNGFWDSRTRILLVEGNADTAALWIALACRSLPRVLAGRLTFTTYTQRPYTSSYQVTGMPADADFAFSEAEITSQYRVYDMISGRSSPPDRPLPWAMAAAALWRAERPGLFGPAYDGIHLSPSALDTAQVDALTGQLAVTAVAHGVQVPAPVFSATMTWAQAHPGEGTSHFWQNFATAIEQGGDAPAATLGRLCREVSMHWPRTVTMPLLGAYLAALPTALVNDPDFDAGTARWAIGRLPEDLGAATSIATAAGQVLPDAFEVGVPLTRGLILLELADALGVRDLPARAASQMLAPALLAGGDSAAAAASFLATTPNATLRVQVLDCLQDEARSGPGRGAAALASAVARWTKPADLTSFPLLQVAAGLEQARRDGQLAGAADTFCRVTEMLRDTGMEDVTGYALGLACAGQRPTVREAYEMLTRAQQLPGPGTQLDRICLSLIRDTTRLDQEIFQLANLLRGRTGEWLETRDAALLDLIAATDRLKAAAQGSGDGPIEEPIAVLRLLCFPATVPQPVRDAATAALLAVLLSPQRLKVCSPELQSELHELVLLDNKNLIEAYVFTAQSELSGWLTESASLHACCFTLWWLEGGNPTSSAWLSAREDLLLGVLRTAARKMNDSVRSQTATELDRKRQGLGEDWLHLIQPPPPSRARRPFFPRLRWTR